MPDEINTSAPSAEVKPHLEAEADFGAPYLAPEWALGPAKTLGLRLSANPVNPEEGDSRAAERAWARLAPSLGAFKHLISAGGRISRGYNSIPPALAEQIRASINVFESLLNDVIGNAAEENSTTKALVGNWAQSELLPYLLLSNIGERWYTKPRGYAGDYLTIAQMYEDRERGASRLGAALDRGFLNVHASQAVKNRRKLMVDEIRHTIGMVGIRPAQVTSLACGPAQEVSDVLASLPDPSVLHVNLIDNDGGALNYATKLLGHALQADRIGLFEENIVYLADGRRPNLISGQDLVYSIGLIDYFSDKYVVSLMNLAHAMLRPGGRVILGNFHPRNMSKAFMDHILEWQLIHRTEGDLNRLFRASAFGRPSTRVQYEHQRINLFAECVRV